MYAQLFTLKRNASYLVFIPLVVLMSSLAHAENITFKSNSQNAAMIELYTSEGCSSCPPAEHWFSKLAQDSRLWKQIFPIAFHVDYWDYLGWKDEFASPAFSLRQRRYERLGHTQNVATPGFVVAGKGWNGWFRGRSLPLQKQTINTGIIHASFVEQSIKVEFFAPHQSKTVFTAHAAILGFGIQIPVRAGENQGKRLQHDFVVLDYLESGLFKTEDYWLTHLNRHSSKKPETTREALVVWVSEGKDPSPIQVTGGWIN